MQDDKRISDSTLNTDYKDGQILQHTDMNAIVSVLKEGINANYEDIKKIQNGETNAGNANALSGAGLSKYIDEELQDDDNKIPTSQQVKAYTDAKFNGVAPQKGVDYWTDSDKEEIVNDVVNIVVEDATNAFNENVAEKTEEFNANATDKTTAFDINANNKTNNFNTNVETKTSEYNNNADAKLEAYNTNHSSKFDTYNANAVNKTSDFNTNATSKTTLYNSNASEKLSAYNSNASDKLDTFNSNATSKTADYNTNATTQKSTFDSNATSKTTAFNNNAGEKTTVFNTNFSNKVNAFDTHAGDVTDIFNDNAEAKYYEFNENALEFIDRYKAELVAGVQDELNKVCTSILEPGEVNGTDITINDSANVTLKDVKLIGDTKQNTTTGSNYLDSSFNTKSQSGVNASFENGVITLNGTVSASSNFYLSENLVNALPTGKYTLILQYISGTQVNGAVRFGVGNSSMTPADGNANRYFTFVSAANNTSNLVDTETISELKTINKLGIYLNQNVKFTNYKFRLFIVSGTVTASNIPAYEPYTGGEASPNPSYPQLEANANFKTIYIPCSPNKTYTFSQSVASNRYVIGLSSDNDLSLPKTLTNLSDNIKTITTNDNTKYIFVMVSKTDVETGNINNILSSIQIEEGSSVTAYEPYIGRSYPINLPVENLLQTNFEETTGNGVTKTLNEDGSITLNGHTTAGHRFNVTDNAVTLKAGVTYTVSIDVISGTFTPYSSSTNWACLIHVKDNVELNIIDGNKITFTPSEDVTETPYLWFGFNNTTTETDAVFSDFKFTIQIEEGNVANAYTPYGVTPIELNAIGNYKDYIYKNNGKFYLHKETIRIILDGVNTSFTNVYASSNRYRYVCDYSGLKKAVDDYTVMPIYCNKLKSETNTNTFLGYQGIGLNRTVSQIMAHINAINGYTLENANNWLKTNNLIVEAPLQTPTDTEITEEAYPTLYRQLLVLETATAYNKYTVITSLGNNLPAIVNAKYYKDIETTVQNLNINGKPLKIELQDLEERVTALENA